MLRCKRRTGFTPNAFTLVELLVVIAVIAVLVAILLPTLGRARAMARNAACMSQLRQISIGIISYGNDYRTHLPHKTPGESETHFTSTDNDGAGQPAIGGLGLLVSEKYLGDHRVLYCTDVFFEPERTTGWGGTGAQTRRWHDCRNNLPRKMANGEKTRCDYSLGWGYHPPNPWGPSPTLQQYTTYSWGYGPMKYWVSDAYDMFPNYGYTKLSHPAYLFMNIAGVDGRVVSLSDWKERMKQLTGNATYYRPYTDRNSWGFWRYYGAGRDL